MNRTFIFSFLIPSYFLKLFARSQPAFSECVVANIEYKGDTNYPNTKLRRNYSPLFPFQIEIGRSVSPTFRPVSSTFRSVSLTICQLA